MTDDKMRANASTRPEQEMPQQVRGQVGLRAQQSQASAVAQTDRHTLPGRRPLFRQ
jgi:hypothetical protein